MSTSSTLGWVCAPRAPPRTSGRAPCRVRSMPARSHALAGLHAHTLLVHTRLNAAVPSRARFRFLPRAHRPEQPALHSRPRRRYPPTLLPSLPLLCWRRCSPRSCALRTRCCGPADQIGGSEQTAQVSTRSTSSSGRACASTRTSRSAAAPHQAGWCGTTSTRVRIGVLGVPTGSVLQYPTAGTQSTLHVPPMHCTTRR